MKSSATAGSLDAKRSALDSVLASRSFDRSDQLKKFLRYVCEMELSGQGQELTEYRIGVEALGRPETFSPVDDSIVRNRAYAVRKKLDEYYTVEAPESAIRIELPKGNYVPRFAPRSESPEPQVSPEAATPEATTAITASPVRALPLVIVTTLVLGILLGAVALWLIERGRIRPEPDPVLAAAWGDLLRPNQSVLVSVATPAHSYIREFPDADPPVRGLLPVPDSVVEWYRRQRPLPPGNVLLQSPTFNSPLWGDAAGAFRVVSTLTRYGASAELMAERLVTPPIFRNRNVIFFGSPEYSASIARLMQKMPLQMGGDRATNDHIAYEVDKTGAVIRRFLPKRDPTQQHLMEVYGLVTVLPAEGDGKPHSRYVIFSGISSAGTEAAAEYFSSPVHLKDLAQRLNLRPGAPWPRRFQVLVHATSNLTVALGFTYETHRVVTGDPP